MWYYAPQAPRLTQRAVLLRPGTNSFFASTRIAANSLVMDVIGVPGRTYRMQVTDDLLTPSWTPIGTVTIPTNLGTATFTDPLTPANRFYRLIYP
jgi:hypothetical protein